MGTLYVISTPIGNLEDLSPRAGRLLGEAALVLAEDTRRTSILLGHLGVRVPVVSHHRHNEAARLDEAMSLLGDGAAVAVVSDAGTPLLSDPGERLVGRALAEGHRVVPVPGPSAILAALVASGLPPVPFVFLGFAPRRGRERSALLERVAAATETAVVFEAPGRAAALLSALADAAEPDREGAVCRELTKMHEEVRRGTLEALARYYAETPPRGEVTIVVAPRADAPEVREAVDADAVRALGSALLEGGATRSHAAREVARRLGVPRNRAYAILQGLTAPDTPVGNDREELP